MGEFAQFALVPEQGAVPEMAQLDSGKEPWPRRFKRCLYSG